MFLAGSIFMAMVAPPIGFFLSTGVWLWGIVDAYRIAKLLQGYGQTAEGPTIEIKKLRFPSMDIRPALPFVAIPVGIVAVLAVLTLLVLARYGLWNDGASGETLKLLIAKIEGYKAQTGSYPDSLKALIDPTDPIEKKQILDRWGNPYLYRTTDSSFELFSIGQDGQPETEDDVRYYP